MAQDRPFQDDLNRIGRALADLFSSRALAWQLGGTIAAALSLAVVEWGAMQTTLNSAAVSFVLTGVGFVIAYTILCITGCIVAHSVGSSELAENPTAPVHFLIDHAGAAIVLPFVTSVGAVALAAVLCGFSALWRWEIWQSVLVIPAAPAFVLALLVIVALFLLLFLIPAMVVMEQSHLWDTARRLAHLFQTRKRALARLFGVGVAVAVLVSAPLLLAVLTTLTVCGWIYSTASGADLTVFASFILTLFRGLLWAPVLAVPLAFLNALAVTGYDLLIEDAGDADVVAVAATEAAPGPDERPQSG